MKINFLILIFFVCLSGFSQTNSLVGKWKAVAINNGEVYYNVATDSISIMSENIKETYNDESKIKFLVDLIKKMYANNRFEFTDIGIFKMTSGFAGTIEYRYKNDSDRNVIVTESLVEDQVNDEMPYEFKDNELYFSMTPELLFILKKEK